MMIGNLIDARGLVVYLNGAGHYRYLTSHIGVLADVRKYAVNGG